MGQKVLVTGADGFIGSHLTEMLLGKGYNVRALSQYNSFNSWGWLENIPQDDKLEVITGDIRDSGQCRVMTQDIDIVFHLASLIAIPYSYIAPESYIETNIGGTLNMCNAARENKVRRFIQVSTSEVYGTAVYIPIDEKHPKQPQSPYSASKIGADAIALSYYHSFNLPVTIARPFNTYGPRQSARAFIPSVIIQVLSGKKVIEVGDIKITRDFNYVKDTCKGLLCLAENEITTGREMNISSKTEIPMEEVIEIIRSVLKTDFEVKPVSQRMRPENSEVYRLCGDNSLIGSLTGYTQDVMIKEGIKLTCDWFGKKGNFSKYKALIYNL